MSTIMPAGESVETVHNTDLEDGEIESDDDDDDNNLISNILPVKISAVTSQTIIVNSDRKASHSSRTSESKYSSDRNSSSHNSSIQNQSQNQKSTKKHKRHTSPATSSTLSSVARCATVSGGSTTISDSSVGNAAVTTTITASSTSKCHSKRNDHLRPDDDWMSNVENAIAMALKKDGIELPSPKSNSTKILSSSLSPPPAQLLPSNTQYDHGGGGTSSNNKNDYRCSSSGSVGNSRNKKRKRRTRDLEQSSSNSSSSKKHKSDDMDHNSVIMSKQRINDAAHMMMIHSPMPSASLVDDIDEYEMMCIRGGSPPPTMSIMQSDSMQSQLPLLTHMQMSISGSGGGSGGVGVQRLHDEQYYSDDSYSSYGSYESTSDRRGPSNSSSSRHRRRHKDRRSGIGGSSSRKNGREKRRRDDSDDDRSNMVTRGNNSSNISGGSNSNVCGPRKLELCKFYLMECCAKREKCLYMHSDFPCKYYYLGMKNHVVANCKFSHGKPLTDQLRNILLKHLETAPKEILGDFPRISRENATNMLNIQHQKLLREYGMLPEPLPVEIPQLQSSSVSVQSLQMLQQLQQQQSIVTPVQMQLGIMSGALHGSAGVGGIDSVGKLPALMEIITEKPLVKLDTMYNEQQQQVTGTGLSISGNSIISTTSQTTAQATLTTANRHDKPRKTRWCDWTPPPPMPPLPQSSAISMQPSLQPPPPPPLTSSTLLSSSSVTLPVAAAHLLSASTPSYLSLKNLTGVITTEQITALAAMGIENLDQINQLTVAQLNQFGLDITQIHELQLNALNMQKLGFTSGGSGGNSCGGVGGNNMSNNVIAPTKTLPLITTTAAAAAAAATVAQVPVAITEASTIIATSTSTATINSGTSSLASSELSLVTSISASVPIDERQPNTQLHSTMADSFYNEFGDQDQDMRIPQHHPNLQQQQQHQQLQHQTLSFGSPSSSNAAVNVGASGDIDMRFLNRNESNIHTSLMSTQLSPAIHCTASDQSTLIDHSAHSPPNISAAYNQYQLTTTATEPMRTMPSILAIATTTTPAATTTESLSTSITTAKFDYSQYLKDSNLQKTDLDDEDTDVVGNNETSSKNTNINTNNNNNDDDDGDDHDDDDDDADDTGNGDLIIADEPPALEIDESWYSSNEDSDADLKGTKEKKTIQSDCGDDDNNTDRAPANIAANFGIKKVTDTIGSNSNNPINTTIIDESIMHIKPLPPVYDPSSIYPATRMNKIDLSSSVAKYLNSIESSDDVGNTNSTDNSDHVNNKDNHGCGQLGSIAIKAQTIASIPKLHIESSAHDSDNYIMHNSNNNDTTNINKNKDNIAAVNSNNIDSDNGDSDSDDDDDTMDLDLMPETTFVVSKNSASIVSRDPRKSLRKLADIMPTAMTTAQSYGSISMDSHLLNDYNAIGVACNENRSSIYGCSNSNSDSSSDRIGSIDGEALIPRVPPIVRMSIYESSIDVTTDELHGAISISGKALMTDTLTSTANLCSGPGGSSIDTDDENSLSSNSSNAATKDKDMRLSTLIIGNELTHGKSDIDLRLPFKPVMANFIPAKEIHASITSHAPIIYKVYECDVPKPDYSEIRRNIPLIDEILDPRLRRILRAKELAEKQQHHHSYHQYHQQGMSDDGTQVIVSMSGTKSSDDQPPVTAVAVGPRIDPRRKNANCSSTATLSTLQHQLSSIGGSSGSGGSNLSGINSTNNVSGNSGTGGGGGGGSNIDIQNVLQKSLWYKDLSSKQKIMVNQQLALVSSELKKFHADPTIDKVFDLGFIRQNGLLQQVLTNLGIFIDDNGQFIQMSQQVTTAAAAGEFLPIGGSSSGGGGSSNSIDMHGMVSTSVVPGTSMSMDFMRPNLIPPTVGGIGSGGGNIRFMHGSGGGVQNNNNNHRMMMYGSGPTSGMQSSGDCRPSLLGAHPPSTGCYPPPIYDNQPSTDVTSNYSNYNNNNNDDLTTVTNNNMIFDSHHNQHQQQQQQQHLHQQQHHHHLHHHHQQTMNVGGISADGYNPIGGGGGYGGFQPGNYSDGKNSNYGNNYSGTGGGNGVGNQRGGDRGRNYRGGNNNTGNANRWGNNNNNNNSGRSQSNRGGGGSQSAQVNHRRQQNNYDPRDWNTRRNDKNKN